MTEGAPQNEHNLEATFAASLKVTRLKMRHCMKHLLMF